jgi:hypothetical protein
MNRVDERDKTAAGTTVLPALIQIQGSLAVAPASNARQRRIFALLDHPVCKHLGISSWVLVAVALGAARPVTAVIVAIVVFAGLLIGAVNGLRWLLGPK